MPKLPFRILLFSFPFHALTFHFTKLFAILLHNIRDYNMQFCTSTCHPTTMDSIIHPAILHFDMPFANNAFYSSTFKITKLHSTTLPSILLFDFRESCIRLLRILLCQQISILQRPLQFMRCSQANSTEL